MLLILHPICPTVDSGGCGAARRAGWLPAADASTRNAVVVRGRGRERVRRNVPREAATRYNGFGIWTFDDMNFRCWGCLGEGDGLSEYVVL